MVDTAQGPRVTAIPDATARVRFRIYSNKWRNARRSDEKKEQTQLATSQPQTLDAPPTQTTSPILPGTLRFPACYSCILLYALGFFANFF